MVTHTHDYVNDLGGIYIRHSKRGTQSNTPPPAWHKNHARVGRYVQIRISYHITNGLMEDLLHGTKTIQCS